MLRIVKKKVVLGAKKPLVFSENVAGGVRRLTGVGVFIPAIENQFASAEIATSAQQAVVVNPAVGKNRFVRLAPLIGGIEVYLMSGSSIVSKLTNIGSGKYSLSKVEVNDTTGTHYLKSVVSGIQDSPTTYYSADVDLSFSGTKSSNLVISDTEPSDKFRLVLKKSDTLTFILSSSSASVELSRDLPIFSEFNGISVKMMINNRQDNPLATTFQPKIVMPFTPVASTTEETIREMKKALYFNLFEQNRLIQMNYDVRNHNKLDFIVDLSEGNRINSDYIGEECDLKVYLRYE